MKPLSRQGRDKKDLRIGHVGKHIPDSFRHLIDGLVIFFHRIPFVHGDNDGLAPLMGDPGNLRILLADAIHGIDDQNHNVRPFHRTDRTENHIPLQIFLDFILPAQSCRVDENIFFSVVGHFRVHGVPGSSRNIGYNQTFFPQQPVDQGRFPHIGLSHNGNPGPVVLFPFPAVFVKIGHHFFQHVPQSQLVGRGNGMGLPYAQIIEFIYIRHILFKAVHLVDHQYHRFMGTPEHIRNLGVRVHKSVLYVHQKNNHVCRVNGNLGLGPHLG